MIFKMYLSRFVRNFLKFCTYLLPIIILVMLAALIIVFIQTTFCREYELYLTRDGVIAMQDFWVQYKPLIYALGYTLTLAVVSYNLQVFIDSENVKALSDLRSKLNTEKNRKLHSYILPKSDRDSILNEGEKKEDNTDYSADNITIFNYLGTLELGGIMLLKGIISYKEFYNQFGYRMENIFNPENERCREIVKHINDNRKHYEVLLAVKRLMECHKNL